MLRETGTKQPEKGLSGKFRQKFSLLKENSRSRRKRAKSMRALVAFEENSCSVGGIHVLSHSSARGDNGPWNSEALTRKSLGVEVNGFKGVQSEF